MRIFTGILAAIAIAAGSLPALAGGYATPPWTELRPLIFGDRPVEAAGAAVVLDVPYRAGDDARVPVDVEARLLDGATIRSVTLIIDGNPMPVSAVFDLDEPRSAVRLGADMRLNGPSPVRAVVETSDGRLLMAERMVKTSGLGACAAPPIGRPEEAIAAIGQMQVHALDQATQSSAPRLVQLDLSHPQHTGMQMDQITLHYILARYVDRIEVTGDGAALFTLTGSISLSEDPAVRFDLSAPDTARLGVRLVDTSETVIERELALLPEG